MTRGRLSDDVVMRQRFGRLFVIWDAPPRQGVGREYRQWICRCDCGAVVVVDQASLRTQGTGTRSCGCLARDAMSKEARAKRLTGDDILAAEAAERAVRERAWEVWFARRVDCPEGGSGSVLPSGTHAVPNERTDDAGRARRGDRAVSGCPQTVYAVGGVAGD